MVTVELIYDPDCPNANLARANLLVAFTRLGIRDRWIERPSSSAAAAESFGGFGSPSG